MPGKYSSEDSKTSFISDWFPYRTGLNVSDESTQPALVTQVIDLSRSFHGLDSEIRVTAKRTAGAGSLSVSLVFTNIGSMAAVDPYPIIDTATLADLGQADFTDLIAGEYRILVTVPGGSTWDLHIAVNDSSGGQSPNPIYD